jgi:SAM-dependent methyltransferase
MDEAYIAEYEFLFHNHWWWRAREQLICAKVHQEWLRQGKRPLRMLDVGCGNGLFFKPLSVYGSIEGVEKVGAILHNSPSPQNTLIHNIDFLEFQPEQRYDLILFLDVLEHIEDDAGFLAHASSLLTSNGRVLISVPAAPVLFNSHDRINHHLRRYRWKDLTQLASNTSFTVIEQEYRFFCAALIKLLICAGESALGRDIESKTIPHQLVNKILTTISIHEAQILPFLKTLWGSSLIALLSPTKSP